MGKLYEKHNQLHALGYYQQAAERFPTAAPELVVLLKDRAWLYILRQEWTAAEADLTRALALVAAEASDLRADIYEPRWQAWRAICAATLPPSTTGAPRRTP